MQVPKVAFINLGCRVNRVETDVIASELERAGVRLLIKMRPTPLLSIPAP